LTALLAHMERLAARQPVLVVYEDVHWIDPTTLELLTLTIERVQHLPVLLLVTARPEFRSPWPGYAHVTNITLGRIGRDEGASLIAQVTGPKALPGEVLQQILARTDGIPLFIEELTKAVVESGVLTDAGDRYTVVGPLPALAIPTSLNASLLARLDRLAPVREVAQIGAALGRQFSHALISAVAPMPEPQLDDALAQLLHAELIFGRWCRMPRTAPCCVTGGSSCMAVSPLPWNSNFRRSWRCSPSDWRSIARKRASSKRPSVTASRLASRPSHGGR
jgi:predicted ATPase